VLTLGLAGFSWFFLRGDLNDLEKANQRAKRTCKLIGTRSEENARYLDAYRRAKDKGGIASPEQYFARVRSTSGIGEDNMTLSSTDRDVGRSRDFKEFATLIILKDVTWDQVIRFMWNTENISTKYKVIEIPELIRMNPKDVEDRWKAKIKAAYRTQSRTS
jgi:hypothetical protein